MLYTVHLKVNTLKIKLKIGKTGITRGPGKNVACDIFLNVLIFDVVLIDPNFSKSPKVPLPLLPLSFAFFQFPLTHVLPLVSGILPPPTQHPGLFNDFTAVFVPRLSATAVGSGLNLTISIHAAARCLPTLERKKKNEKRKKKLLAHLLQPCDVPKD